MTPRSAAAFHPLTPDRWPDLETLFGPRGACGGCWCMWFRLPRAEYEAGKGDENRRRLKARVERDDAPPPGLLAYRGARPVGWCAIAPRPEYRRLATTRTMKPPADAPDLPVWAVLCLFVDPAERRRGLSVDLLRAACRHAAAHGAPAVEAYPVIPGSDAIPPVFASQGTLAACLRAGFAELARPSASRAVVRWYPEQRRAGG